MAAAPTSPAFRPAILIVDDDDAIRGILRDLLEDEGYIVRLAATHEEAFAALSDERFALVLTDTAGQVRAADDPAHWRQLGRVRDAAGDTPTIICSAHGRAIFADYAAHGFAGLITKPFDLDAIAITVRETLAPTCAACS
jgi:DNA-binding NtrC family response regulator